MYIARFDTAGGEWIQAMAQIRACGARSAAELRRFWLDIASHLPVVAPDLSATVARRITVEADGQLHEIVSVTAPARGEWEIRRSFGRLTRIERTPGMQLVLPQEREESDRWMEDLDPLHYCFTSELFSVQGLPLACDFRISPHLDELLTEAVHVGHRLAYQVHVRGTRIDPEWLRAARKNVVALHELPGARSRLLAQQEELATNLGSAAALGEEYLAVGDPDAAARIGARLAERFRERYSACGFAPPPFLFVPDAHDEALLVGVHSHDLSPLSPVELCGIALTATQRVQLLGWSPSAELLDLLPAGAHTPGEGEGEGAEEVSAGVAEMKELPTPCAGDTPFVFISYKRQDLDRIVPILDRLSKAGVHFWFDRSIPGGTEWDAVIESQLTQARFLLLFTSQAAVDSKYVRREVKFADTLDIPILPVTLEDVELRHGLQMLLSHCQIIDARAADFAQRLRQAVDHLLASRRSG